MLLLLLDDFKGKLLINNGTMFFLHIRDTFYEFNICRIPETIKYNIMPHHTDEMTILLLQF